MRMTQTKWLLPTLLILILALVLALLLRPQVIEVNSAVIENGTLVVTVDDQGRTRARDPFIVAAPIYGRLLRSDLREGDVVTTGQVIARIALPQEDTRTQAMLEANLMAAQARYEMVSAELMEAEAAYDRALREEDRRQRLAEDGLISQEERESFRQLSIAAEVRVMSLSASIEAVSAEVESARTQLLGTGSDTQDIVQNILSPADGTIYRLFERNERVVAAGSPLMSISDQDALEIVVDLLTQDAVRVEAGDRMLITGWGGDAELEAEVAYVEPQAFTKISALGVEEQRVNVIANFLDQPRALGGEYRIEASIIVDQLEDVPLIPSSAIFQRNNTWYTFVVENGNAVLREVEIGLANQDFAEVRGLLEPGDRVILFPSDLINDGVVVAY